MRVETVNVSPFHPGSRIPWDGPAPATDDGAECGLIGVVGSLVNPIVGAAGEYLCKADSRPQQREQDPSAPDLVVLVGARDGATYQTYTARDTFYHAFRSDFVVPVDAIPAQGLYLTVHDRDGSSNELIGTILVGRQQLVGAALSTMPITLSDPLGGLQRIELVVSPYSPGPGAQRAMDVRDGTASFGSVRAGEVVEIVADGKYRIGSFHDQSITPAGYPDGGLRGYNFDYEPFRSAPHGSGIALVGTGDAKIGKVVAQCTKFVSNVGGLLVLGVNDREPRNNEGQISFSVRVRGPTPSEWLHAPTLPCTVPAQP